ncbi:putative hydro-lyase [Shimia abyssi]|uniref:Uncharacterized protein YcsI (UPF0317 family) n=1 Tax=Shimia abyssi TaxID=1662395 RepID=A0A2P8FB60_9RHOB|nr:putative hydro-lyase [Shimia abyssi]PSL18967.1 uncharacterized protein YcsI (UPF0317 family) [Shimia abyssi]
MGTSLSQSTNTKDIPEFSRIPIRSGDYTGPTSGMAPHLMQANLVILPRTDATSFHDFCMINPKPCPLLAVSAPGEPRFPTLGADIDLRSDLPGYKVWQGGKPSEQVADITKFWRDDLIAFALGCSFGFEAALIEAGIELPHFSQGRNVAMFETTLPLASVGPFKGSMVVSMRYVPRDRVEDVYSICGAFPQCHGEPVHIGDPDEIGIFDLNAPDYGDPPLGDGIPVFWACGVTPQSALRTAKLDFAITHEPGKMLICDVPATFSDILNAPL